MFPYKDIAILVTLRYYSHGWYVTVLGRCKEGSFSFWMIACRLKTRLHPRKVWAWVRGEGAFLTLSPPEQGLPWPPDFRQECKVVISTPFIRGFPPDPVIQGPLVHATPTRISTQNRRRDRDGLDYWGLMNGLRGINERNQGFFIVLTNDYL